jgi:hypothetical protein
MYRQHLVIFCNNKTEALTAAASLPPNKDLSRFFVLNCEKPLSSEMSWLRPIDDYLSLGKANEFGNATEIGIRAGILYIAGWWHLFFCHADNLPNVEEIDELRKNIDMNKGFIQMDKIWGVSKEHVLLFGLSNILGSGISKVEENNINSELEIIKALKGKPVNLETFISAFLENVPTSGMVVQGDLNNLDDEANNFIKLMITQYPTITETPGVIFVSSETSQTGLNHIISSIEGQTLVAVIGNEDFEYSVNEIYKFNCENKFILKLYSKK